MISPGGLAYSTEVSLPEAIRSFDLRIADKCQAKANMFYKVIK